MELWGQIISVVAMAAIILSFQCKSNRSLATVFGLGAGLFAVSFFMLGQPSGAAFNIIAFICSLLCMKEKLKNIYSFALIVLLCVIATRLTYDGWWSLALMAAQLASSGTIMLGSGKLIRNMRLFFISPVWLINNTVICFSIGGIICEIITMTSVVVSFIRYRKTGFEQ